MRVNEAQPCEKFDDSVSLNQKVGVSVASSRASSLGRSASSIGWRPRIEMRRGTLPGEKMIE